MFVDHTEVNSIATREAATGAGPCIYDEDLRRGDYGKECFCCTLWIGGKKGNSYSVRVLTQMGDEATFSAVPAGTHLRIQVQYVFKAGTTIPAEDIVCLY